MNRIVLVLWLAMLFNFSLANNAVHATPDADQYQELKIEGWRVMVSPSLQAEQDLMRETISQITADLKRVIEVVPDGSIDYLKESVIWLEHQMPSKELNRLFFNSSQKLTAQYGLVPQSYGGVIVGSAHEYLAMAAVQPWQLLHELAHGFHKFNLQHSYEPIRLAYQNAKQQQLYSRARDKRMPIKVYAMKSHREYFAELTVTYFARLRMFPHDRNQLAEVDPKGYCAVVQAWGLVGKKPGEPPLFCH